MTDSITTTKPILKAKSLSKSNQIPESKSLDKSCPTDGSDMAFTPDTGNAHKCPTMLMILDGYGLNPVTDGNAVEAADTPNLDRLFQSCPHIRLAASGLAVGLPDGQMGNSEVGHLNIGAGRIVYQELTRITKAIDDGIFAGNAALNRAIDHVLREKSTLHIFGLLSDGGVHSHIDHIKATVRLAQSCGIPDASIVLHCFTDGRDVPPTSGITYIEDIEKIVDIGTVSGRYYAMDRDKRWERVEMAYNALTLGEGLHAVSGSEAVRSAYASGLTDEFILPTICDASSKTQDSDSHAVSSANLNSHRLTICDNDAVIFCNFRPDRARELTRAFVDPDFDGFVRKKIIKNLVYVCMTQYDATMPNVEIAFPPQTIRNTLGEYLSACGLTQLRIAETEKYAHVTFFFNGGVEAQNPLEDRILIPSPKVSTYDLKPEMSAFEVTDRVVAEIQKGIYDVIILNFANADMVGHTGVFDAAVKAIEALDGCVQRVVDAVLDAGGQILLTADHGNADCMLDSDGNIVTAHSTNPVPLMHISNTPCVFKEEYLSADNSSAPTAKLADIAPTLLRLMGLPIPPEMDGSCLCLL